MHPLATTAQMKELDRMAIQEYGILSLDLMERAALSVSGRVLKIAEGHGKNAVPRAAVFCGPGNNGGDGIAAARLLIKQGFEVRTFLIGNREKMTADAKAMEERLLAAGGKLEPFAPDKDNGLPGSKD